MTGDALFAPIFVSDDGLRETSDAAWLQAMLDVEVALANALARSGVIPTAAADAIAEVARVENLDPAELGRSGRAGGNPVIPLVDAMARRLDDESSAFVHFGATSQDILDTAAVLVARRVGRLIDERLTRSGDAAALLADRHRHTLMAGRTLLQQALPTSFGLKAAGWCAAIDETKSQLRTCLDRLPAQLGGAAGTLASLETAGPTVVRAFAEELGLPPPLIPWHSARQRLVALVASLASAAGTAGKIASDIVLLMQTEVGEVSEPSPGGSSTLPHKRNPTSSAIVIAAAHHAHSLLPVLFGALIAEHERPAGAWHAEWRPFNEVLALAEGATARIAEVLEGLEIDEAAMARNLAKTGGALMSEHVTLALTAATGQREGARQAVSDALELSVRRSSAFVDELRADPFVAQAIGPRLDSLLEPRQYLGSNDAFIDAVLQAHQGLR